MRPEGVSLDKIGLTLTVHSTKCTGAGKKVEQVFAYVSNKAYFLFKEWMVAGLRLLDSLAGKLMRDYLLPLPTPDFHGVRNGPVLYTDALNMTRTMLRELERYRMRAGKIPRRVELAVPLLHMDAAAYWSEHSDRAQLISWAACCEVERSAMDTIG